jgi:hypothetical protein
MPAARRNGEVMGRVWFIIALVAIAGAAAAQPARVAGDYSGQYFCSQGLTGMTVRLAAPRNGSVDATIVFFAHPDNPGVASGCYTAHGRLEADGHVVLNPGDWLYRPAPSWSMTVLDGRLGADGSFAGRVIAPTAPGACTTFALRRGAAPFKPPPSACQRTPLVG